LLLQSWLVVSKLVSNILSPLNLPFPR
jgi:hypothetical protein